MKNRLRQAMCAVAVAAVLALGCTSTFRAYKGPERPAEQSATIQGRDDHVYNDDVYIVGLRTKGEAPEGMRRMRRNTRAHKVVVLPGTYRVSVIGRKTLSQGLYEKASATVTVVAEAGHAYEVSIEFLGGGQGRADVLDVTEGGGGTDWKDEEKGPYGP